MENPLNCRIYQRLAHLIKVCGFLLQTKVYLFWGKPEGAV